MTNWPIKLRSKKPRSKVSRGQTEGRGSRGDARGGEIAPDSAIVRDGSIPLPLSKHQPNREEINDDENIGCVFGVHADALCQRLVAANRVMIDRLAHRLDEVGELTGEQIGFLPH
jgi:hypothetical protein